MGKIYRGDHKMIVFNFIATGEGVIHELPFLDDENR